MANDKEEQVVIEVKEKSLFVLYALQVDNSIDISSASQLMVFVRYVVDEKVKEELFFLSKLKTTTKVKNVISKVEHFF